MPSATTFIDLPCDYSDEQEQAARGVLQASWRLSGSCAEHKRTLGRRGRRAQERRHTSSAALGSSLRRGGEDSVGEPSQAAACCLAPCGRDLCCTARVDPHRPFSTAAIGCGARPSLLRREGACHVVTSRAGAGVCSGTERVCTPSCAPIAARQCELRLRLRMGRFPSGYLSALCAPTCSACAAWSPADALGLGVWGPALRAAALPAVCGTRLVCPRPRSRVATSAACRAR